jgi:hypothetical protein
MITRSLIADNIRAVLVVVVVRGTSLCCSSVRLLFLQHPGRICMR